jgi:hypothetical protein
VSLPSLLDRIYKLMKNDSSASLKTPTALYKVEILFISVSAEKCTRKLF